MRAIRRRDSNVGNQHHLQVLALLMQVLATDAFEHSEGQFEQRVSTMLLVVLSIVVVLVTIALAAFGILPSSMDSSWFNALWFRVNLVVAPSVPDASPVPSLSDVEDDIPELEEISNPEGSDDPLQDHSPRTRAMILDVTPPVTPSNSGSQPELEAVEDMVPPLELAEHEAQPVAHIDIVPAAPFSP